MGMAFPHVLTCINFISVLNSQCWLKAVDPILSLSPISSRGGDGFRAGAGLSPPSDDHRAGLSPLSLCSALAVPDIIGAKTIKITQMRHKNKAWLVSKTAD